jgi:hypothetical protein
MEKAVSTKKLITVVDECSVYVFLHFVNLDGINGFGVGSVAHGATYDKRQPTNIDR